MKLGVGEAIFFAALMLSLLAFVAQYNKGLGESEGRTTVLTEEMTKLEVRMQTVEHDLRGCKP